MKRLYLFLYFIVSGFLLSGQVVISEIMYNDPSVEDTLEYIEIANAGNIAVNLQNYYFGSGVSYTFPAINLAPGTFLIIAKDSIAIFTHFNKPARQWKSGALNNNGEPITLVNATNQLVDSVRYENDGSWKQEANGGGFSINLCDLNADNNIGSNWNLSSNNTGAIINGLKIYASPGGTSNCYSNPLVKFISSSVVKNEADAGFIVKMVKNGLGSGTQSVSIQIATGSTAENNKDFSLNTPYVVNFNSNVVNDTQTIVIPILEDTEIESTELIILEISDPQNLDILPNFDTFEVIINDNDVISSESLILTGVFDAQPGGIAGAKGIEIFVLKDIPDLSIYGVGSATNGGGSDGVEFVFPAVAVQGGTYIHITSDSIKFHEYFGFPAEYNSSAVNINGDDAIELFESGGVIDVFGQIDVDGTAQPWEYLDGWAYRKDGTGPDGSNFIISNWKFSGVAALDGPLTNAGTPNPFPINTYKTTQDSVTIAVNDYSNTDINSAVIIDVLNNDNLPNGIKNLTANDGLHGITEVTSNLVIYTPDNGFCGIDSFLYFVTDNKNESAFATVTINVICSSDYPEYDIATITTNNLNGVADSLDVAVHIEGVVYGNDFQGNNNLQFYVIDNTGGISISSNESFGYTVKEGDKLSIKGKVDQFAGLTQIIPDSILLISSNNPLIIPTVVSKPDESTESEFIRILNLHFKDKSQWTTGTGTGFNVELLDDLGNTIVMRIDNDIDLFNMPVPAYNKLNVTGIGSQFDNSQPFTEGYMILPRYISDIENSVSTYDQLLQQSVFLQPNIFKEEVTLVSNSKNTSITIIDIFGKQVMTLRELQNGTKLVIGNISEGIYFAKIEVDGKFYAQKLIKQ